MAIKTAIELEVKQPSLKGFKQELYEAKLAAEQAVMTFGEFSPEAIKATQKVAQLRDRMDDFNDRVSALNPDKFAQINTVVSSVARGFQAAQGAMALFGSESQNMEKTLVKLQGAMALAEGLEGLGKIEQQFLSIATTIKDNVINAFGSLQKAFNSLGIGLLLTTIGYLIDKLSSMKSEEELVKMRLDNMTKSVDYQTESLKKLNDETAKQVDFQLRLAEAMGKSVYEQYIIQIEGLETQVKQTQEKITKLTQEAEDKRNVVRNQFFSKTQEQRNKEIDEINKIYNPKILSLQKELQDKLNEQEILAAKEETRQKNEALAKQEKRNQLYQEQLRKNAELQKKIDEEEYQRLFELQQARLRNSEIINNIQSKGVQQQAKTTLGTANEVSIQLQEIEISKYDKLKAMAYLYHSEIARMASDSLDVLAALNENFAGRDEASQRKAFEISKKIRIASTIIDSTEGTVKAFKTAQESPITALFPGYPFVQAAIAAAWGVARVKQIQNTQWNSASFDTSNGGQSSPNISVSAPNMGTSSSLPQDNGGGRVYVLEGDISRVQNRMYKNRNVSVVE
jgi:hypothetical protein